MAVLTGLRLIMPWLLCDERPLHTWSLYGKSLYPTRKKGELDMFKIWTRLQVVFVILAALAVTLTAACSSDNGKGTIFLVEQDWDGQLVTTAIAKILLEEEMGFEVASVSDHVVIPKSIDSRYPYTENGEFAELCRSCGICFVGPGVEVFEKMGDKAAGRSAMEKAGVPTIPGSPGP